jgi:hypothetical protein
MGTTAKVITAKISDASASAYAGDLGILYQPNKTVSIGAVAANLGTSLKLVDEADSLPAAGRLGASFHWSPEWDMTVETVYRKTGLLSGQAGVEWRYGNIFALRGGFNSSRTKELGLGAGFSAGVGLFYLGQEFAYAYVPLGDLGQTHYLSLVFRFTSQPRPGRPVLHADSSDRDYDDLKSEGFGGYQNLYDVLSDDEKKSLEKNK